jgi:hypothetical protein
MVFKRLQKPDRIITIREVTLPAELCEAPFHPASKHRRGAHAVGPRQEVNPDPSVAANFPALNWPSVRRR